MKKDEAIMIEAAIDVAHEFRQLFFASKIWERTPEEAGKRLILDAYIMHCSSAIEFLYGDESGSVHAGDFFDDPVVWQPVKPDWYDTYRRRRNKLLAHLTYERIQYRKDNKMAWSFQEHVFIRKDWESFLVSLPPARKAWFRT